MSTGAGLLPSYCDLKGTAGANMMLSKPRSLALVWSPTEAHDCTPMAMPLLPVRHSSVCSQEAPRLILPFKFNYGGKLGCPVFCKMFGSNGTECLNVSEFTCRQVLFPGSLDARILKCKATQSYTALAANTVCIKITSTKAV